MSKLHFLHSVMNAGKSTHLLQVRHNYMENGGNVLLFTSAIDDRRGIGTVSSRIGIAADAVALKVEDDLLALVAAEHTDRPVTAVLVDEVQFLTPDHIRQAAAIVDDLGIPVMCYGLKNNCFGTLFSETITTLVALADQLQEIKTLCHCGRKATMILRYDQTGGAVKSGSVVEVGGEDRYVSVCRRHWNTGDIGAARRSALPSKEGKGS